MISFNRAGKVKDTCLIYGNFDGVHKGHLKLVKEFKLKAKDKGLTPVIFSKAGEGEYLTSEREKEYLFKKFLKEAIFISTEKNEDIEAIIEKLGVRLFVIGEDDVNLCHIKEVLNSKKTEIVICKNEISGGEIITSERIKKAVYTANLSEVRRLSGHPYIIMGEVVHGKALGKTVGMPTANIYISDNKIKPAEGVYASLISIGEESYKAVTNIGKRPSVDNFNYITVESFILDFDRNIYGEEVVLSLESRIREVKKFDSLLEVKKQVEKDIKKVRMLEYKNM